MVDLDQDVGKSLGKLKDLFKSFSKSKISIGIDIGSHGIKVVELKREEGGLSLSNYAYVKTKEDLVKIGSRGVLSDASGPILEKILALSKIDPKEVNVSVPSFSSLVTIFDIPSMPKKDIEQAIRLEAPKYIPVKLSDVIYGWEIVSQQGETNSQQGTNNLKKGEIGLSDNRIKVLVVAIMKEISQKYEKVFSDIGIKINSLEVDSFSLARSLSGKFSKSDCNLILDIGHKTTNLIVVNKGKIVLNRTIDVAGDSMNKIISSSLGVDEERAEKTKIKNGINSVSQGENSPLVGTLSSIVNEIKNVNASITKDFNGLVINKVILTGGGAQTVGLKEYIERETGLVSEIGNPFNGIRYPENIKQKIAERAPFSSVAVGLAMLGFED